MNDFDYENKQKKDIARSARYRKGGSKSKKCNLPHDHYTPAQLQALNGPVTTILLNQPMDWETFKGLSDTLKIKYIENLRDTYQVSLRMLGKMFGVSDATVRKELNLIGIKIKGTPGHSKANIARHAAWEAFCNGVIGGGDNIQPKDEEAKDEPQATCYDVAAEEFERAKLAAGMAQAEAEIAENSEVYSARTKESEEFTGNEVSEQTRDMTEALTETLADLNKLIDEYEDDCNGCHCSAEPVNEYQMARLHKMQVNLEGEYTDVADQIALIVAMFGGHIKVRMEIVSDEVVG